MDLLERLASGDIHKVRLPLEAPLWQQRGAAGEPVEHIPGPCEAGLLMGRPDSKTDVGSHPECNTH